jgi:hypothetical protein
VAVSYGRDLTIEDMGAEVTNDCNRG